jgi:hypothetical protein
VDMLVDAEDEFISAAHVIRDASATALHYDVAPALAGSVSDVDEPSLPSSAL